MADEKKKKGAAGMYGKSPKIEDEPVKKVGDENTSGHEEKAAEKAAEPPKTEGTMDKGGDAKGEVMAGTAGIPTHHMAERHGMIARHAHEMTDLHHRHMMERSMGEADGERHHKERMKVHSRHEAEMKDLDERHGGGPTGGKTEKEIGKGGTEPKE